jgi:adenosylmethionine-8-amino-7-oxononanoate aminotransferase
MDRSEVEKLDSEIVWHPYSSLPSSKPNLLVHSAEGTKLHLENGQTLIDGMSSWWTAIHGYNHPVLNQAASEQLERVSHVMFGGLTHRPAVELAQRLVNLTPSELHKVFFSDSGSVAIEVAMKMALQYWVTKGENRRCKFLTLRRGYHGDTLHAMSVCDPVSGMHTIFAGSLPKQVFVKEPVTPFNEALLEEDSASLEQAFSENSKDLAACILEPIVQGAGGMRFYSADYLIKLRELCDEHEVLLICDEIATGFGRTGKMFACDHAGVSPDILALGKALTGGYLSLAATVTRAEIAEVISANGEQCFMHGPTFMANPLACAIAGASIDLLLSSNWEERVGNIESTLKNELSLCSQSPLVREVRCLGAIGVIELEDGVEVSKLQDIVCQHGVWLRPFRNLLYTMPPYISEQADLLAICSAMRIAVESYSE